MSIVLPVNDDPRFRVYTASAGQTVFAVPFVFQSALDIAVMAEVDDEWVLIASGYTITGADNPSGGTLTFSAGRTAGERILVLGKTLLERLTSVVRNGRFASGPLDDEIDRLTMIAQELTRDAKRAVKAEYGATGMTVANEVADGQTIIKQGDRFVPGPAASLMEAIPGYASATQGWRNEAEDFANAAKASELTSAANAAQTGLDRAAARASEQNAYLAALFAGAPIEYVLPDPVPAEGSKIGLKVDAGIQGWVVEGGVWVNKGFIGPVAFTAPLELHNFAGVLAPPGTIVQAGRHRYQVVAVASSTSILTIGGYHLEVLEGEGGIIETAAWAISTGVDETAKFTKAVERAAGRTLLINFHVGTYISDRLIPGPKTVIVAEPGVDFRAIDGGTRCIQVQQEDVHIWAYGATFGGIGTQSSHRIYFTSGVTSIARRCSIRGGKVIGAGNSGDDCIYVGGDPANGVISEDIQVIDVEADGDGVARNVLSIAAVNGCLVEGCDFYNPLGAPGLGIDVEANLFMADGTSAVRSVTIRRCKVRDCPNNAGIGVIFGSEVTIDDCDVWGNRKGIIAGAGGTQFNSGVYRPGDRLGVGAFDTVDGWITVSSGGAPLTDSLGIVVGMLVVRNTSGGATWPAEFTSVRYVITDIDATQTKVKVGFAPGVGEVIPSTGGTGTLSIDPEVSGLDLLVYGRAGNNDKLKVTNCRIWGNTAINTNNEVEMGTSRDILFENNDVESDGSGCDFQYSTMIRVIGNRIRQKPGKTVGRGLGCGGGFDHIANDNHIEGFADNAIQTSGGNGSSFERNHLVNCGHNGQEVLDVTNHKDSRFIDIVIRNDASHQPAKGASFGSGCNRCVARGLIAKGVAGSNDNSLFGTRFGVRFIDCIQYDGTTWGEVEETFNPDSIAAGASITHLVAVPGAVAGDYVMASFGDTVLSVHATPRAGQVEVRLTNNSASPRDASAQTLRVKVCA